MEKTIAEYKKYSDDAVAVWKERFTWKRNGKDPQYRTSIVQYVKESPDFENVIKEGVPTDSAKFFEVISVLAEKYVSWACNKDGYKKTEEKEIRDFFVGAMGEYFFYFLMTDVKCVECCNENNEYNRYDFRYTYPYLVQDFGIDLVSAVSSKNQGDQSCAIQVKFWNPFNKETPDMSVFQKLGYEAYRKDYADPKKDKNLFFCWLGEESKIYKLLEDNKDLQKSVVVIGHQSLQKTVNNNNNFFWKGLFDSILEYKNVA